MLQKYVLNLFLETVENSLQTCISIIYIGYIFQHILKSLEDWIYKDGITF